MAWIVAAILAMSWSLPCAGKASFLQAVPGWTRQPDGIWRKAQQPGEAMLASRTDQQDSVGIDCSQFTETYAKDGYKGCTDDNFVSLCDASSGFCEGGLGYRRCTLPQFPMPEDADKYKSWVHTAEKDEHVVIEHKHIKMAKLMELKPSQVDINMCKACSISWDMEKCFVEGQHPSEKVCDDRKDGCFCAWKSGMVIAENKYVLDGHHRWAAVKILESRTNGRTLTGDDMATVDQYNWAPSKHDTVAAEDDAGAMQQMTVAAEESGSERNMLTVDEAILAAKHHPNATGSTKCT